MCAGRVVANPAPAYFGSRVEVSDDAAVAGLAASRARGPERAVRPGREDAIVEIATEQAELPELVGDVLADVGHDSV